ncbi:hypothetical protein BH23BAC1_BH23BAC1_07480 [soil metagenome]
MNLYIYIMIISGNWHKDNDGFMYFSDPQVQRMYEAITSQYYGILHRFLEDHDEEFASLKAKENGFFIITDYKEINGRKEFSTSYVTPSYVMDLWYDIDHETGKKDYKSGSIRIISENTR